MSILKSKIDYVVLISVEEANPNGDSLNDGRPRTTYLGYGEMSDVSLKRKIRNRLMQMGLSVFYQPDDKKLDQYDSLQERYNAMVSDDEKMTKDDRYKEACALWDDVRLFGATFAFKNKSKSKKKENDKDKDAKDGSVSIGVTGASSMYFAKSVAPVNVVSSQITKSANGSPDDKKSSDTMGMKYRVEHGLYIMKGSISPIQAAKNGFTEEDAEHLKEAILTMFEGDASASRPEGSMRVIRLYWFKHNGYGSTYKTHHSVKIRLKDGIDMPQSLDDYEIDYVPVDGVDCEIIECE